MRYEPRSHVHIGEQWKPQSKTSKKSFHVSPEQKAKLEIKITRLVILMKDGRDRLGLLLSIRIGTFYKINVIMNGGQNMYRGILQNVKPPYAQEVLLLQWRFQ